MGRIAEEAAAKYLTLQGYVILERNYRTSKGEMDIIAEHQDCLVFIEVRSRQDSRFGLPQETVNITKRLKLRKLATYYLRETGSWNKPCRFDVVGVLLDEKKGVRSIELIRDAF